MKVLHILTDGPVTAVSGIVENQAREHHVEVVDISQPGVSYELLVDKIFAADKVVSWSRQPFGTAARRE